MTTYDRSYHVSVQERGINALYKTSKVIEEIQKTSLELPTHPVLGKCSWAICKMEVVPNVVNVVPDRCVAEVDTRSITEFSLEDIIKKQMEIIKRLEESDPEFKADVNLIEKDAQAGQDIKRGLHLTSHFSI